MYIMKTFVVMFLMGATSLTTVAQTEGQTVADPAEEESRATRRLIEICQDPYVSPGSVESAIRDGADLKALARVPVRVSMLEDREVMLNRTAFQLAVMNARDPRVIEVLIDAGSKPTRNIMRMAARRNPNPEVIATLEEFHARIQDAVMLDWTDLFSEACESNGSVPVIRWFLDSHGNDLNTPNEQNADITPFQAACGNNPNPEVIELLVENGGDLKATRRGGISPLMFAAISNTPEIARTLIKSGSEVDYRTHKGMNAYLYAALSSRYPDVFQVLVEHGADPNATESGMNAIVMAAITNQNPGIMAAIIDAGTTVPALTELGDSVLEWACENKSPSVVGALLDSGIDPNPKNVEPPLLAFARRNQNPSVIQTLLDAGADVNARSTEVDPFLLEYVPFFLQDTTPLMLACCNHSTKEAVSFVEVFLNGGANVNSVNQGGYTPLMFAVNKKSNNADTADVVRLLIRAGADPNARTSQGLTALDIARANPDLKKIDLDEAFQAPEP